MEQVYALRLKNKVNGQDCFYVGKAKNKARRLHEHKSGGANCAKWVQRQGGVAEEVQLLIPRQANLDPDTWEQKETIARIIGHPHGFDCVRGWEWTNAKFGMEDYISFKKLALGAGNFCRNCGYSGHFAAHCGGRPMAPWLLRCLEGCKPASQAKRGTSSTNAHIDASQIIAAQVGQGNEWKRPPPEVQAGKQTRKRQCRQCEGCGIDVSDKPASHRVCLKCFLSAKSKSKPESESSESDHFERERQCRQCEGCGIDLSDKPASHRVCLKCFRSAKSKSKPESESSESDHFERECQRCNEDIGSRPASHRFCYNCFRSADSECKESEYEEVYEESEPKPGFWS
jgi:hypothetical protein